MRPLLCLAFVACGGGFPPELPLDAEYTTCEVDADCVRVELACCDDCNGGTAVAVNRGSRAEVEDRFAERPCRRVACTLMACPDPVVSCDEGTCAWEYGDFDQ